MSAGDKLRARSTIRTDWAAVLADLAERELTLLKISKLLDIPDSSLRGWKKGIEPGFMQGHQLMELWSREMGRDIADRPMRDWGQG